MLILDALRNGGVQRRARAARPDRARRRLHRNRALDARSELEAFVAQADARRRTVGQVTFMHATRD